MRIVIRLSLIYTLLLLLLFLSWQGEAHMWSGWLALPNILAPFLFLPLVPLLLFAFWLRSRLLWGCTLTLLLLALLSFGGAFLPRQRTAAAAGDSLRVLSFNHLYSNRDRRALRDLILRHDADVVGLQETTSVSESGIGRALKDAYPYQLWHAADEGATDGTALLSRYPLRSSRYNQVLRGEQVRLEVAGKPLTLINLHLNIPFGHEGAVQSASYDPRVRHEQILSLIAEAERHPRFIVMGDFNLSDREVDYRRLSETLTDTYRETQRGLGYTFPNGRSYRGIPLVPFIRIDYVWLRGLEPLSASRDCRTSSDHCALIADIALP